MKKCLLCVILPVLLCGTAGATAISVSDGFTNTPNQGVVSPVVSGATSVTFSSLTMSAPSCAGVNASLCTTTNVLASSLLFSSGTAETFTIGSLSYTTSGPWSVVTIPGGGFFIGTLGNYSASGFSTTAGDLNFTFQVPPVGDNFTFSASGSTVPEPSTLFLLGAGLLGVIGFQKRRRLQK